MPRRATAALSSNSISIEQPMPVTTDPIAWPLAASTTLTIGEIKYNSLNKSSSPLPV
jgi:hypothetical protein